MYANEIGPDLSFFIQFPHFPGFFDGTAPLYIHIHFLYHPRKRSLRRKFRLQALDIVTEDSYDDWLKGKRFYEPEIRSSWWEASYATNKLVQCDDQGRTPNLLKRPGIKFLFSATDPKRPYPVVTRPLLVIYQRWTYSSQDVRNTDLDLVASLATILEKEQATGAEPIIRDALLFAENPRWVARAVEFAAKAYVGSTAERAAQDPQGIDGLVKIAEGLSGLGLDPNLASALWFYTVAIPWRDAKFEEDYSS
ncbi:hypothetical protein P7C70_g2730, partial [Phenoliferia sp. Uapishka_3]